MSPVARLNWKLIALCAAAFILSAAVSWGVYGAMPHIEDEHANVFHAKVFAGGSIAARAPAVNPQAFTLPFVVNRDGWLFGKYPPGYSLLLVPAAWLDQWWLLNALAAAGLVLGVYLLGRDLYDARAGLLAAALGLLSPMFILLSGALVSHLVTMLLLTFFAWGFARARLETNRSGRPITGRPITGRPITGRPITGRSITGRSHPIGYAAFAGFTIGWAFITRPWSTFAIGLPFAVLALIDLVRRWRATWRLYGVMLIAFGAVAVILPLYNQAVTGAPFTNTYALWWDMDQLGFGPGIGVTPGGHTLITALINFRIDFPQFWPMLLGWPSPLGVPLAWLPLLAGLLWPPLLKRDWALFLPPLLLFGAHWLYWARGSSFYGPRYYAEAMPFLWLIAARGLIKVCAVKNPWPRRAIYVALPVLIAWNIVYTIEPRFIRGFAEYRAARRAVNTVAQAGVRHALVFVKAPVWQDYADLGWLNAPRPADGDIIYAYDFGPPGNAALIAAHPDRAVYYFDRSQPYPLVKGRAGE